MGLPVHAEAHACDRAGTARWCSGHDIQLVRLVSKTDGQPEYNGPLTWMCADCRAVHGWRVRVEAQPATGMPRLSSS